MTRRPSFRPLLSCLEARWLPSAAPYPDPIRNAEHDFFVAEADQGTNNVVFLGDSITALWQDPKHGSKVWQTTFAPLGAADFGIIGDTTQNLLARVENGELAGKPKVAVVMIGFNDLLIGSTPSQAASGVSSVVQAIRTESPGTHVLLLSVLPNDVGYTSPEIPQLNAMISALGSETGVTYLNDGSGFQAVDGFAKPGVLADLVHPSTQGYQVLATEIDGTILNLLGATKPVTTTPAAPSVAKTPRVILPAATPTTPATPAATIIPLVPDIEGPASTLPTISAATPHSRSFSLARVVGASS